MEPRRLGKVFSTLSIASADILYIWHLFEREHLFGDIFDGKGQHDPFLHLAKIVRLIGPPPREFVRRSETTEQCFDSNGKPEH